jgi:predicted O-linked N-acetylglucosamine transferase (SPINDLY family)
VAAVESFCVNDPDSQFRLGNSLKKSGELPAAIEAFRKAIELRPDFVEAWNNLGNALKQSGKLAEAVPAYQRAIALRPGDAEAYFNLGNTFGLVEQMGEAIAAYRRAIAVRPDAGYVYANLGNALRESGELDEAIACYRRAVELEQNRIAAGNLLYTLYLHPDVTPQQILQEHALWNERFARPLVRGIRPHENDRSPDRRLRVAYVSHDLSLHPVGRFMLPLLAHHDQAAFQIFCYSDGPVDVMTERIKPHADTWRDTTGMPDEALAEQVRQDRIDILVDLSMHTNGGRMDLFARKPAPVQVTYLAYCGTTGLETIDYRLSDSYLDPSDRSQEAFYSEKSVRLSRNYWCYEPLEVAGEVSPAPSSKTGAITFGCFNKFAKASTVALEAWARILREAEGSRLMLQAPEGPHRDRAMRRFATLGVDPSRVAFVGRTSLPGYFARYAEIDIALDSFPCSGGTVTCDALWMGVPVVSLAGRTAMGRSGLSILSNVGLAELVAGAVDQYVQIAVELSRNTNQLRDLRAGLRDRMRGSPLMQAQQFARDVEAAFGSMWRKSCEGPWP